MIRYIGYPCINMNLSECTNDPNGDTIKIPNKSKVFSSRTFRMSSFSLSKASELSLCNVRDLAKIIRWNIDNDIHFFRISSNMFPFIDHPDTTYNISDLPNSLDIIHQLKEIGEMATQNNVRLTCHPGPYTCIASPNQSVVSKSILSIEKHAEIAQYINTKDFNINIHVGGNYGGDFIQTANSFCDGFRRLSPYAQSLLTIENDDKPNMWSVSRLYNHIFNMIGIPIVLDMHHWQFNHEFTMEQEAELALSTWGNKTPKMHYSESRCGSKPQAHSDYISKKIPEFGHRVYDVMIESKQKEKSLLQYRQNYL